MSHKREVGGRISAILEHPLSFDPESGRRSDISIHPGWIGIVEDMYRDLAALSSPTAVMRLDEKYGDLCITLSGDSAEAEAIAGVAQGRATSTCRACGARGRRRSHGGWISVLCHTHADMDHRSRVEDWLKAGVGMPSTEILVAVRDGEMIGLLAGDVEISFSGAAAREAGWLNGLFFGLDNAVALDPEQTATDLDRLIFAPSGVERAFPVTDALPELHEVASVQGMPDGWVTTAVAQARLGNEIALRSLSALFTGGKIDIGLVDPWRRHVRCSIPKDMSGGRLSLLRDALHEIGELPLPPAFSVISVGNRLCGVEIAWVEAGDCDQHVKIIADSLLSDTYAL